MEMHVFHISSIVNIYFDEMAKSFQCRCYVNMTYTYVLSGIPYLSSVNLKLKDKTTIYLFSTITAAIHGTTGRSRIVFLDGIGNDQLTYTLQLIVNDFIQFCCS